MHLLAREFNVEKNVSYSRRRFLRLFGAAGAVPFLTASCALNRTREEKGSPASISDRPSDWVRLQPREYARAFANPLKGFRPDLPYSDRPTPGLDNPLATVVRHYIRWNQIENSREDGLEKIIAFCNSRWAGLEQKNQKVIPRVYLYWPKEYYWPADLPPDVYGSRMFLYRLGKLIEKLGQAWDRDPRVAYVETGIVGPCGEQWGPTPHEELRRVLGDSYREAFPNKLCMIRYPWQWLDYEFGVFWDSWGTNKDTRRMLEVLESPPLADSWKTRVRGGEISYGFGEPPGLNPDDTMAHPHYIEWIECLTRRGHWNHLGWVAEYDWRKPVATANAERLQKVLGYRFVVDEVCYPAQIKPGRVFEVTFSVRNTGSSPFYYRWPVVVCLLEEGTHRPAWEGEFTNTDIRRWLPGDRWGQFAAWNSDLRRFVLDDGPACYQIPAEKNDVRGEFILSRDLKPGHYIVALAILDPAGRKPCCRFAIEHYFAGGYHPIGRIAVGRRLDRPALEGVDFDDLASDTTLGYKLS